MALLNLDLRSIANARPDLLPAAMLALPVVEQLATLVRNTCDGVPSLHAEACRALAAMRGPFYVSAYAMANVRSCAVVSARRSPAELPVHAAAFACDAPAPERWSIGTWPRLHTDRGSLEETWAEAQLKARARAAQRKAAPAPVAVPESGQRRTLLTELRQLAAAG